MACWNIDGLYQRVDNIRICKLEDPFVINLINSYDIFCMTETHCNSTDCPILPGYKVYLNNRPKQKNAWRASGGIACFVKESISKGVKFIETMKHSEICWLKLTKGFFHLLNDMYICIVYMSPHNSSFTSRREDLFEVIENNISTLDTMNQILILGDFNARTGTEPDFTMYSNIDKHLPGFDTNLLDICNCLRCNCDTHAVDNYGRKLLDMCKSTGLRIINGRSIGDTSGNYTCFSPAGPPSVIDYALAHNSILNDIHAFKVGPLHPLSIHCPIGLALHVPYMCSVPVKDLSKMHYFTKFKKWQPKSSLAFQVQAVQPGIVKDIETVINVSYTCDKDGVDELVSQTNQILHCIAEKSNIIKRKPSKCKKQQRKQSRKWYDRDCNSAYYNVKQLAHLLFNHPCDSNIRQNYFKAKKEYKYLLKKKKRAFQTKMLNILSVMESSHPKEFWSVLNEIKNAACKTTPKSSPISQDDFLIHFKMLMKKCTREIDIKHNNFIENYINENKDTIFNELNFTITEKEIINAIYSLKSNKSPGYDGMPNELLKSCLSKKHLLLLYKKMFNLILSTGVYPTVWQLSTLTPIYKKGDKTDPNNYRGIAVSTSLSKLLSLILNNRLSAFLKENNIIPENQIGFQKGHRTTDHIFAIKTIIDKYLWKLNQRVYACFVDFKKAFDTIWRKGLIFKMLSNGIGGNFLNLIISMYSQVKYCIKCANGGLTDEFSTERGLKQGGILSPNLFNIYIYMTYQTF